MNTEGQPVPLYSHNEIEEAKYRMTSIRFDCFVKMFDYGQKLTNPGWPLPPQWFKSEIKLTMEAIEHEDPRVIGNIIKDQFRRLNRMIEQYESGEINC